MRRALLLVICLLASGVALAGSSARAVTPASLPCSGHPVSYAFQTFDARGHVNTGLHGANHRGAVTGYFDDGPLGTGDIAYPTGFVLRHGEVHPVVWAPGIYSDLNDVNDAGNAVGYYGHVGKIANFAFLYRSRSKTPVPLVFPSTVRATIAAGINDHGAIVGTLNLDQTGLPQNADHKGYLKDRGQVTSPAYELVSYPGAPETFANGINDAGTVVGNYHARRGDVTSARAFVRRHGAYSTIDLDSLGATKSEAWGANEHDDVVGFYSDAAGVVHGFLADRHRSVSRIDVPRALATRLYSITDHGVLYGTYDDAGGVSHGFVATPHR
jgi:hypothetical protein